MANFIFFLTIYNKHEKIITMGRKKINPEEKTRVVKIHVPEELYEKLEEKDIKNKSKLFNWLLEQHFGFINDETK